MKTKSIFFAVGLAILTASCAKSTGSKSETPVAPASELSLALGKSGSVYTGDSFKLKASGGSGNYVFSISEGDGTIDASTGAFQAPSTKGYVTVEVEDDYEIVQLRFYVQAKSSGNTGGGNDPVEPTPSLTILPENPSVEQNSQITLSASGGVAPYTFSVVNGSGAFTGAVFRGNGGTGTTTVRVTDQNGLTGETTITLKVFSAMNEKAYFQVDHKVGVTLWNPSGARNPSLLVFGTGMDVSELGKNVYCGYDSTTGNLRSPCAVSVALWNIENDDREDVSYRGTLVITGRNKTVEADFCIIPKFPDRVYLAWKTRNQFESRDVTYSTYGYRIASGKSVRAHFNTVDTDDRQGSVSVEIKDAKHRAGETGCPAPFSSTVYAEVAP
jgi:hypothetical protein